jgi:molybdopterin/thiamine biosynthesis adenylyltransferase
MCKKNDYLDRYSRNILVDQVGKEGQLKLLNSKVLVAGAGGLGSTVIVNLASIGIGNIGIIDNDNLELSNLNRQYIHKLENIGKSKVDSAKNWIQKYNPDINVNTYAIRLDENNSEEIISSYDIVLDCFDSYKSKFLLNKACIKQNKTFIHGGVTEFFGQVMTIIPGKSACLSCLFPDYDINAYVIKGVISPAVSTIASIQSMEAVKIILGAGIPLTNQLLTFDGLKQEFKKITVNKNEKCPLCK